MTLDVISLRYSHLCLNAGFKEKKETKSKQKKGLKDDQRTKANKWAGKVSTMFNKVPPHEDVW
jgi:hypothetical protein